MLAVLFQGGVIQTHNHLASTVAAASGQRATPASISTGAIATSGKSQPVAPLCPLCEERALFGSYLLAVPLAFVAPSATPAYYAPAKALSSAARQVSHAWRSRAPPIA